MSELVALLDLGSNAARFLVARINQGVGYRVLYKERVQTRLGGGRDGELPVDAVDRTLTSVSRFLERVTNGTRPRVLAVATAAIRDASNRDRLLGALRDGVVADLGGGSLQLTRVRAGRIVAASSLPLGAVRLTRRFLRRDPPRLRQ